jgi:hypothetical protein
MRIGLEGFGSIWSVRETSDPIRRAFYNTTGVLINGRLRHRSQVFGAVRFNEVGGFNALQIERNLGRTFESDGPVRTSRVDLFLRYLVSGHSSPDFFLFAVRSERTGRLQIEHTDWISDSADLISLSSTGSLQEALLLMPLHSWIRGKLGRFVVEARADRPSRAFLRLVG